MHNVLRGPALQVADLPDPPHIALLHIVADLDLATLPDSERQLAAVLDSTPTTRVVILDFTTDAFVCVRGVRMLRDLSRRLHQRHGRLLVCGPPPVLRRMIQILTLDDEIEFFPSIDEALRAVGD
jgi:anti-anti-sigma factor